jgi:hypothetical protein
MDALYVEPATDKPLWPGEIKKMGEEKIIDVVF